jgi:hypothetical protein
MGKPRLTLADLKAYELACSLKWDEQVLFGDKPAKASGILGNDPCFKVKGKLKRYAAGDPILLTLRRP